MYAFKGDRIHVHEGHGSTVTRDAEVLSGDYTDGRPPYWVRWVDSGEQGLLYPPPTADVEHAGPSYPAEYETRWVATAVA